MVVVVQLVRTPDCGSGGRRFESGLPPKSKPSSNRGFFCTILYKERYINILKVGTHLALFKPKLFVKHHRRRK